jgi:hypothetical protein
MPSWKKVITSGSDASLASLFVANAVTSSIFSGSRYIGASFTGSFSGSIAAPGSNTNIIYNSSGVLAGSSNFIFDGTNVGIGTTTPSSNLDIRGASDTAGQISLQLRSGNTSVNFNSNQITFGYANTALYRHAIKTRHNSDASSGNAIDFYTWLNGSATTAIGGQHVMSLNGANVGIGTTTPQSGIKLDVSGAAAIAGGTEGIRLGSIGDNSAYDNVKIYYTGYNSAVPRIYLTPRTTPGSGIVSSYFHLLNSNGNSTTSNNTIGLLVDGNVGIGTTIPDAKLTISASSGDLATFYTGTTKRLTVTTNGELSFNTNSSLGLVWSPATLRFEGQTTGVTVRPYATNYVSFTVAGVANQTANLQTWQSSGGTIYSAVNATGSFGIGTSTPITRLHVSGNTYIDGRASIATTSTAGTGLTVGGSSVFLSFGEFQQGNALYFYSSGNTFNTALAQNGNLFSIGSSVYVSSSNNVGIGTSTLENIASTTTLTINGSTGGGATSYQVGGVRVGLANGNDNYFTLQSYNSRPLSLGYNNNNTVVINTSNNVGIGTTNPIYKLHSSGIINSDGGYVNSQATFTKSYSLGNIAANTTYTLGQLDFGTVYTHHFRVRVSSYAGTKTFDFIGYQAGLSKTVSGVPYQQDRFNTLDVVLEKVVDGSNQITGVKIGIKNGYSGEDFIYSATIECLSVFSNWTALASNTTLTTFTPGVSNYVIAEAGSVGIGTTSPGTTLDIIGNVRATSFTGSFSGSVAAAGSNTQIIYNNSGVLAGSSNLVFNGSNVGIGSVSPAYPLDVNGTVRVTTLIETSTKILKENIQPYSTDINKFKKLKPVSFNWKDTKKEDIGLIAEDLNKVFPEFVSKDDGKPVGIHYGKLAAIFINVIKEQQERIEALEKQVKKLIK